jgi:thioredoxin reductase (NADPH)
VLQRGDQLTAQETFRRRVEEQSNIDVRTGITVEEILGDEKVTGVRTSDGELELDAVFPYIGLEPNVEWLGGEPLDAPGLYVAGIVRPDAAGRAAASAGDGAHAALAAYNYLAEATAIAGGSRA